MPAARPRATPSASRRRRRPSRYASSPTTSMICSVFCAAVARSSPRYPLPSSVSVPPFPGTNASGPGSGPACPSTTTFRSGFEHQLAGGERCHDTGAVADREGHRRRHRDGGPRIGDQDAHLGGRRLPEGRARIVEREDVAIASSGLGLAEGAVLVEADAVAVAASCQHEDGSRERRRRTAPAAGRAIRRGSRGGREGECEKENDRVTHGEPHRRVLGKTTQALSRFAYCSS